MIALPGFAHVDLPDHWKAAPLGVVTTRPATVDPRRSPGVDIRYIDIGAIDNSRFRITSARTLMGADAPTRARQLVKEGDTLYSTVRVYLQNLAMVTADLDGAVASTGFAVLRPNPGLDPRFLNFWVQTPGFTKAASELQRGISYPAVNERDLLRLGIPIPPLDEQQSIVATLDQQLSRLEAGVDTLRQAGQRLARLRADAMEDLLAPSQASRHPSATRELGDLLEDIEAGKSFKCVERPAQEAEWGVIKVSAMTWGAFRAEENKTVTEANKVNPAYEIRPGDLLMSRANTVEYVGAVVLVDQCRPRLLLSDKSLRLLPRAEVDPAYLLLALRSRLARQQIEAGATGTSDSMRNLSQSKVRSIRLTVPELAVQGRIVSDWSRLSSGFDALDLAIENAMTRAGVLRYGLLEAAFTGRLVGAADRAQDAKPWNLVESPQEVLA